MGFDKIARYSQAAVKFGKNNERGILAFKAESGSTYKYNPKTNEFTIISRDGKIVTYYNPDKGIKYFYERFENTLVH